MSDERNHDGLGLTLGLGVLGLILGLEATMDLPLSGATAAVAVALAAVVCRVPSTLVVAVATIAGAAASGLWNDNFGTQEYLLRLGLAGAVSVLAVMLVAVRERHDEIVEDEEPDEIFELEPIAMTAQRAVLRTMPSAVGSVGLAARYLSATSDALVGGDLYEVLPTRYGVRLIVGDVRGKGLEAVQLAATMLGAFRRAARRDVMLTTVAKRMDEVVRAVAADEDFVTVLLAEFHDDNTLSLVNCGHHPPVMVEQNGSAQFLYPPEPTPPLGLSPTPGLRTIAWPAGARLLMYTDGLVEARNSRGAFFPLVDHVAALRDSDLDSGLEKLISDLLAHTGQELDDDLAVVLAGHR